MLPDSPTGRQGEFRLLLMSRVMRSFALAIVSIIVPLIVARSGVRPVAAGFIFLAASLGAAVLLVLAGFLGDRVGRRPILFWMAALAAVTTAGFGLVQAYPALLAFAFLGALARGGGAGSGGAWGPFAPVEQPLIAEVVPRSRRNAALGQLAFVGVLAGAAGSIAASLPDLLHSRGMGILPAEGWTMAIAAVFQLLAGIFVLPVREAPPIPVPTAGGRLGLSPGARSTVAKLSLTNGLNGFGIGFLGPFLTYWLHVRYGVGASQLALLYTLVNLVTAFPYLGAARIAARFGSTRAILWTRLIGALFTALLPLAPSFFAAGVIYLVRMVFQTVGNPIRQSLVLELVEPAERGRVSSASALPSQITTAISPAIGGALMEIPGLIAIPLYLAAIFMTANSLLFNHFFQNSRDPATTGDD